MNSNRIKTFFAMFLFVSVLFVGFNANSAKAEIAVPDLAAGSITGIAVGNTTNISIDVTDVANVIGAQLHITFDPAILQVVGTVNTGACPVDVIASNTIDNVGGDIFYAAANGTVTIPPECALSFNVATIDFQCAAIGTSAITFVTGTPLDTVLSDSDGNDLTPPTTAGSVECVSSGTTVTGIVEQQIRVSGQWANTTVSADDGVLPPFSTVTAADGTYTLLLPAGTYTFRADKGAYIDSVKAGVVVSGPTLSMTTVSLRPGEMNDDAFVNILDVNAVSAAFLQPGPWAFDFDYNLDAFINILDVNAVTGNFLQPEPDLWP